MKIYIVQYRQSGEDYQARAFRDINEAEAFAVSFLENFVCNPEKFQSLAKLEEYCFARDLAYIDLESDVI